MTVRYARVRLARHYCAWVFVYEHDSRSVRSTRRAGAYGR